MYEIEVINILKRCSDKKAEGALKSPAFLQQNTKHLEINKYIMIIFPLQRHLAFLKDFFFVFVFCLGCK